MLTTLLFMSAAQYPDDPESFQEALDELLDDPDFLDAVADELLYQVCKDTTLTLHLWSRPPQSTLESEIIPSE